MDLPASPHRQSGPNSLKLGSNKIRLTSTILLAQVWEPPDIAQADTKAQNGHEKLHRTVPLYPFLFCWLIWKILWYNKVAY